MTVDPTKPVDLSDLDGLNAAWEALEKIKIDLRKLAAKRRTDQQVSGAFSDASNMVDEAGRGLSDLQRYLVRP